MTKLKCQIKLRSPMTIEESKNSASSHVILSGTPYIILPQTIPFCHPDPDESRGKDLRDSSVVPITSGLPQNDNRVVVTTEVALQF